MRTFTGRFARFTAAAAISALAALTFSATPAAAAPTPVQIYSTSFESAPHAGEPDSGWALDTSTTLSNTTWGESTRHASSGSRSLWCAGTNEWQTIRDYYTFNNDEDGSMGPNDPVAHYHGGMKLVVKGVNGSASSDCYVDLDFFYLYNSVTGIGERVEEDDPRLVYTGTWSTVTDSRYSGGAAKVSNVAGSSVYLYISGSATAGNLETFEIWYGAGHTTSDRGQVDIYHAYDLGATGWGMARPAVDLSVVPLTYSNYMEGNATRDVTLSAGYTSASVSFWYLTPSVDSLVDFGVFEVSTDGGATWHDQYSYDGYALSWTNSTRPLTAYIPPAGDPPRTIKIRWRWHSNNRDVDEGMYIDEVSIDALYDPVAGDTTPPSAVTVTAPSSTSNLTAVHTTWTASADAESGIAEYQCSIGTAPGLTNVEGWDTTTTATDATIPISPRLEPGTDYFVNVRAKNGAGLYSTVGSSPAVRTLTTTGITCASNRTTVTSPNSITLSGILSSTYPTASALDLNGVQVQRRYPSETAWTTIATGLDTTTTGAWAYSLAPSRNAYYRSVWVSSGDYTTSASPAVFVNVAQALTIKLSRTSVPRRGSVKFSGHLDPHRTSKVVYLQYKSGRVWKNLTHSHTTTSSNYSITRVFAYPGTYYVRTYSPADSLNTAGYSSYKRLRVT